MKTKYILIISLLILFAYLLKHNFSCVNYNGNFHYSSHVVSFHLQELIATESQTPILLTRVFHNKVTVLGFDIFTRYVQFFDIFYLINILGLAGAFGLLYFYYCLFCKKIKNSFIKLLAFLIFLFPFLEIFQLMEKSFVLKMVILVVPLQIASLMGSFYFSKKKAYVWITSYLILLILSVGWIIVFQNELLSFCTSS